MHTQPSPTIKSRRRRNVVSSARFMPIW